MSTFALYYNAQDLAAMAGSVQNPGLTSTEKTEANRYWNGGLKNWASAPFAVSSCDQANGIVDPLCQRVVVTVTNRTLADLRNFLYAIASKYGASFEWLQGLANDMAGCSGAEDPFPPA